MSARKRHPVEPPWGASGGDARALLPLLRQQLRVYADLPSDKKGSKLQARSSVAKTAVSDLPADMQELVGRYEQSHPGVRVEPVHLLDIGIPEEAMAQFTAAEIPKDDEILILVLTETAASAERVEVRSRILIARRRMVE
jgi:hypothetical protein